MDLAAVLRTKGADANDNSVARLQAKAGADYEASQRALLGEAGFRQLQNYERTSTTRDMVSAIAGVAAVERAPFTPQQADALDLAQCAHTAPPQDPFWRMCRVRHWHECIGDKLAWKLPLRPTLEGTSWDAPQLR